jgi:hypothetical protein
MLIPDNRIKLDNFLWQWNPLLFTDPFEVEFGDYSGVCGGGQEHQQVGADLEEHDESDDCRVFVVV